MSSAIAADHAAACIVALEWSMDHNSLNDCCWHIAMVIVRRQLDVAFVDFAVVEWDKVHSGDMQLQRHRESVRWPPMCAFVVA